jgi:hypothetical protein
MTSPQYLYTRSIRLVGIHVSLLPSVSKVIPNAALALEEAQLVAGWKPLGNKDVPCVGIQAQHVHLDLLPQMLSQ